MSRCRVSIRAKSRPSETLEHGNAMQPVGNDKIAETFGDVTLSHSTIVKMHDGEWMLLS